MSSDEEHVFDDNEGVPESYSDNEEVLNVESCDKLDNLSGAIDVTFDPNDSAELERVSASDDQGQEVSTEEPPLLENGISIKTEVEEDPSEAEERNERRQERQRRRREEWIGTAGTTRTTVSKFEHGEIDDGHFHKTDTSHDEMAKSGTVLSTTAKFRAGKYHSESDEESKKPKEENVKEVVECGTAAARRKALEEHAEEARRGKSSSPKVLQEDAPVLKPGRAANTRAKLERLSSEEKVLEKEVDLNTPKSGTASARRARFEEKARQASLDEVSNQKARRIRRSRWPEPNTNYRQRKSLSTDDESSVNVEKENAKNIEKSLQHADDTENGPQSPVKTSEIRNKLVKMLSSEDERPSSHSVDLGPARPSAGTARNLRARFEAGKQTEESYYKAKSSVNAAGPRSGYALKVCEKFESGEVSKRRSSSANEDEDSREADIETRRRRTSSTRSVEDETSMISRSAKELRSRFENPSQNTQHVKRNFVLRPKASSANISSRFNKTAPAMNKCNFCARTVYPMEMITADDKSFHKRCFKCTECKSTLRLGNYAALQGQIYCKPHFKQLFKVKGNYDEGFGRQQHKKNWEDKTKSQNDENKSDNGKVDDNDNIKTVNDTPYENGYDHPSVEQTNGFESSHGEDGLIEDGIAT